MRFLLWLWSIYYYVLHNEITALPCIKRDFGKGSFVCVCNSTYCDTVVPDVRTARGSYSAYMSSKTVGRLDKTDGTFQHQTKPGANMVFTVDSSVTYQSILGFGGAFTDAAGINIGSLPEAAQDKLMQSYYSTNGIEYNVGRNPMGSCDFSLDPYSYDPVIGDLTMTKFFLQEADKKYKIPYMQKAMQLSRWNITFFASPWSAPAWMKTNNNMTGYGSLIGAPGGEYYKAWARYYLHFLNEYASYGIHYWGVTTQNEPSDGCIHGFKFQAMCWTPENQSDWIGMDLGPMLEENGYGHVKIMILDDQRVFLPYWPEKVFQANANASKYVSGIAVHWYMDNFVPSFALDITHKMFPDKFMFGTEACVEYIPVIEDKNDTVSLGNWERGERYIKSIIQDISHWVIGWTDWNLALDMRGGPNWVENFVDSPIIVNADQKEFYKQPMFYALGHFSKFVHPGSVRIGLTVGNGNDDVLSVAFKRPDDAIVLIIANFGNNDMEIGIKDALVGTTMYNLRGHSMQTFIWWRT